MPKATFIICLAAETNGFGQKNVFYFLIKIPDLNIY